MGNETDSLYDLSNISRTRRLFKMTTNNKETQDVVRKMKHKEKQLSLEIGKMNSELEGNLSGIDKNLRKLQSNHLEVEPYYLRRRSSTEPTSEVDYQDLEAFRRRSSSFGTVDSASTNSRWLQVKRGSSQTLSHASSRDSISSTGSSKSRGQSPCWENSRRRDSSPSHKLHLGIPTSPKSPCSRSPTQNYFGFPYSIGTDRRPSWSQDSCKSKSEYNSPKEPDINADCSAIQLRRVQVELNHRTPKSVRQLKQSNKTSAEEREEYSRLEEEYLREKYQQDMENFTKNLEECNYIRRPCKDTELTVDEIFGHSID